MPALWKCQGSAVQQQAVAPPGIVLCRATGIQLFVFFWVTASPHPSLIHGRVRGPHWAHLSPSLAAAAPSVWVSDAGDAPLH